MSSPARARLGRTGLGLVCALLLSACDATDDHAGQGASTVPAACDTTSLAPGPAGYADGPATLVDATLCVSRSPVARTKADLRKHVPDRTVAVPLSAAQLARLADARGPGRPVCGPAVDDVYLLGKTGAGKVVEVAVALCGTDDLVACGKPPCPRLPLWKPPADATRLIGRLARRAG